MLTNTARVPAAGPALLRPHPARPDARAAPARLRHHADLRPRRDRAVATAARRRRAAGAGRPVRRRLRAGGDRGLRRRRPARGRPPEPGAAGARSPRASASLDVPVLLLWGARDPVFTDLHLADLRDRLPAGRRAPLRPGVAPRHRGRPGDRGHRLGVDQPRTSTPPATRRRPEDARPPQRVEPGFLWAPLTARADDPAPAVVELHDGRVSLDQLRRPGARHRRPRPRARGRGVRVGDRVAVLVTPGAALTTAVFACWRVGAVIVVADAGLGLRGLAHALRSARPDHVIGIPKAVVALNALRVPGRRFVSGTLPGPVDRGAAPPADRRRAHGARGRAAGGRRHPPGAARGRRGRRRVLHLRRHRAGQGRRLPRHPAARPGRPAGRDLRRSTASDAWVAAFALFALYGPALGTAAAVPGHGRHRARHADRRRPGATPRPRWTRASSSRRRPPCATWSPPPTGSPPGTARRSAGSGCSCRPARRSPSGCCAGCRSWCRTPSCTPRTG